MTSGHDIAMGLRAAYWTMHRRTAARLAKHGVTADQLVLLALLSDEDGVKQQELVRRASSDPNTIRAMLVLLEERGFVAREPHPTDGRALSVTITKKGQNVYNHLMMEIRPLQKLLLDLFEEGQAASLVKSLNRVSEAMKNVDQNNQEL